MTQQTGTHGSSRQPEATLGPPRLEPLPEMPWSPTVATRTDPSQCRPTSRSVCGLQPHPMFPHTHSACLSEIRPVYAATPVDNWPRRSATCGKPGHAPSPKQQPHSPINQQAAVAAEYGVPAVRRDGRYEAVDPEDPVIQSGSRRFLRKRPGIQIVQFLVVHIAITRNWPSRLSQESTPVGAATFRFVQSKLVIPDARKLKYRCCVQLASQTVVRAAGRTTPADPNQSGLSSRKCRIQ